MGIEPTLRRGIRRVHPAGAEACITWFQATRRAYAGKRLLTNREWQGRGTRSTRVGHASACLDAVSTGLRSSCKSSRSVFDMVGNVDEWVAD